MWRKIKEGLRSQYLRDIEEAAINDVTRIIRAKMQLRVLKDIEKAMERIVGDAIMAEKTMKEMNHES